MCELVNICYRTLFNLSFFEFIMLIQQIQANSANSNQPCLWCMWHKNDKSEKKWSINEISIREAKYKSNKKKKEAIKICLYWNSLNLT
jgi:hypothetical protein